MKKIIFVLIVMSLASCRQKPAETENPGGYETLTVTREDITLEQTYPASIQGRQSIRIIPRTEGYLSEIRIKEGQRVHKGQILFIIDQTACKAEVDAARANVAIARAGVESAQLNHDSRQQLWAKKIVSDYDLRSAATQLSLSKAQLQQAEAQLESALNNLSYTTLRSPSDGIAGGLPYRVGDYVGPTIQDGLTTIADDSSMHVFFSLTERDVMSGINRSGSMDKMIASFPRITLQTPGGATYPLQGRLESVSGVVDHGTGALSARAVFPNPDGKLLSGSTGRITVPQEMSRVIVIPQEATYEIQDKVYIYKVVDGHARSTVISVIPSSDGLRYVVTSGLEEGETIVARGASYLKDGMKI